MASETKVNAPMMTLLIFNQWPEVDQRQAGEMVDGDFSSNKADNRAKLDCNDDYDDDDDDDDTHDDDDAM